MILTNNQREYFGLEKIEQYWEKVQIFSNSRFVEGDIYLYFDGNTIRKLIITNDNFYHECKLNEKTQDRKIVLPKTKRGKPKKLNYTSIMQMARIGVYLYYDGEYVTLANHTTQTTFYQSKTSEFHSWINKFIEDTTEQDLIDIDNFKMQKESELRIKKGISSVLRSIGESMDLGVFYLM